MGESQMTNAWPHWSFSPFSSGRTLTAATAAAAECRMQWRPLAQKCTDPMIEPTITIRIRNERSLLSLFLSFFLSFLPSIFLSFFFFLSFFLVLFLLCVRLRVLPLSVTRDYPSVPLLPLRSSTTSTTKFWTTFCPPYSVALFWHFPMSTLWSGLLKSSWRQKSLSDPFGSSIWMY